MKLELKAKLGIFSKTLTPSQIDAHIGMRSDKNYLKGDLRKGTVIREKENGWIIYSQVNDAVSMENHINELLDKIKPAIRKIRDLADQDGIEVELGCTVWGASKRPPLFFTRDQIDILCQIGASIDIDLY